MPAARDELAADPTLIRPSDAARRPEAGGIGRDTLLTRAARAGIIREIGGVRFLPLDALTALAANDLNALRRWRLPEPEGAR